MQLEIPNLDSKFLEAVANAIRKRHKAWKVSGNVQFSIVDEPGFLKQINLKFPDICGSRCTLVFSENSSLEIFVTYSRKPNKGKTILEIRGLRLVTNVEQMCDSIDGTILTCRCPANCFDSQLIRDQILEAWKPMLVRVESNFSD